MMNVKFWQIRIMTLGMVLFNVFSLSAQVSISGPACVLPGTAYQYKIKQMSDSVGTIQVCVQGGSLQSGGTCVSSANSIIYILVEWLDTTQLKLNAISVGGVNSLSIVATHELVGGSIDTNDIQKTYIPGIEQYWFHCTDAAGGTCDPHYTYQWQKSVNGVNWQDIGGATARDYQFNGTLSLTTQFRRKCIESGSNTIAYSDIALLLAE